MKAQHILRDRGRVSVQRRYLSTPKCPIRSVSLAGLKSPLRAATNAVAQQAKHGGASPVMTLKEAAAYLRVSKAHLSNLINGKVPGVPPLRHTRIGRRTLVLREWADELLDLAGRGFGSEW
jgi:hypothetical protein